MRLPLQAHCTDRVDLIALVAVAALLLSILEPDGVMSMKWLKIKAMDNLNCVSDILFYTC